MRLKYKKNICEKEIDGFVKSNKIGSFLQGSKWKKVKTNWENFNLGFYSEDELVGIANILVKVLPLGFTAFYIPRGPVIDYSNKELVDYVFQVIKNEAKKQKALFVKYDPAINKSFVSNLNEKEWSGETKEMSDTIQPRFQAILTEESLQKLSKSTKQTIRTAKNKGVETVHGRFELLDDFALLMEKTSKRKGISLRSKEYFEKILNTYEDAYITVSYLDVNERINLCVEKQKEKRYFDELNFLLDKEMERTPLSATLTIVYGETSDNLYAGMDETFKRYQSAIVTWFETAKYAFSLGVKTHNLGGVENSLEGPLYSYKSKFKPEIEEYIGEFTMPTSSLYPLFDFAYKLRKKLK